MVMGYKVHIPKKSIVPLNTNKWQMFHVCQVRNEYSSAVEQSTKCTMSSE